MEKIRLRKVSSNLFLYNLFFSYCVLAFRNIYFVFNSGENLEESDEDPAAFPSPSKPKDLLEDKNTGVSEMNG